MTECSRWNGPTCVPAEAAGYLHLLGHPTDPERHARRVTHPPLIDLAQLEDAVLREPLRRGRPELGPSSVHGPCVELFDF